MDCPWNSLSRYMFRVVRNEHFLLRRTETSLSLVENVRAKEGGKETSVPFLWFLAVHHQLLASTINRLEKRKAKNEVREEAAAYSASFRSYTWELFALSDSGFALTFGQIVSISVKELNNTNLVASRHIKRERASLPVDACSSKTCLLNLPNKGKSKLQFRFSCYYNNGTNQCTVITGPNLAFFHDKSVPTL